MSFDATFAVGEHVEAQYNGGSWYKAEIASVGPSYTVTWNSGKDDDRVKLPTDLVQAGRLPVDVESVIDQATGRTYFWNRSTNETTWNPPSQETPAAPHATFAVGDQVDARYSDGNWYKAQIASIDASYTVTWADGKPDDRVKSGSHVRVIASPHSHPRPDPSVPQMVRYWKKHAGDGEAPHWAISVLKARREDVNKEVDIASHVRDFDSAGKLTKEVARIGTAIETLEVLLRNMASSAEACKLRCEADKLLKTEKLVDFCATRFAGRRVVPMLDYHAVTCEEMRYDLKGEKLSEEQLLSHWSSAQDAFEAEVDAALLCDDARAAHLLGTVLWKTKWDGIQKKGIRDVQAKEEQIEKHTTDRQWEKAQQLEAEKTALIQSVHDEKEELRRQADYVPLWLAKSRLQDVVDAKKSKSRKSKRTKKTGCKKFLANLNLRSTTCFRKFRNCIRKNGNSTRTSKQ